MIGIGEFVERNIRDRPFILLDESNVGDTDQGLAFDDSRLPAPGIDQERLLLGQALHIVPPFGADELLEVPEKFRRRRGP